MQEKCGVVWGGVTCWKNKNRTDGEEASVCLTIYVEQCSINLFFFLKGASELTRLSQECTGVDDEDEGELRNCVYSYVIIYTYQERQVSPR